MKNLTKLLTLIVVFCSVIISGCRLFGGYSEESVPATPPVPVFSVAGKAVLPSTPLGNKIAPADSNASEGISLTIRAQKAAILTGLQAVVVDMLGNRIGEPVPVDDQTGDFKIDNVPAGEKYRVQILTSSGNLLLQHSIDMLSANSESFVVDSESTAISILVEQSGFTASSDHVKAAALSGTLDITAVTKAIVNWLTSDLDDLDKGVLGKVLESIDTAALKEIVQKIPVSETLVIVTIPTEIGKKLEKPVLTAEAGDARNIINWQHVNGAMSYFIVVAENPGVEIKSASRINYVTSPFMHEDVTVGKDYFYRVVAVYDQIAVSSDEIKMTAVAAVAQPEKPVIVAQAGDSQITLSFTKSPGVDKYTLYWNNTNNFETASSSIVTDSIITRNFLINDTDYYYWLVAENRSGKTTSDMIVLRPVRAPVIAPPPIPEMPEFPIDGTEMFAIDEAAKLYFDALLTKAGGNSLSSAQITALNSALDNSFLSCGINKQQFINEQVDSDPIAISLVSYEIFQTFIDEGNVKVDIAAVIRVDGKDLTLDSRKAGYNFSGLNPSEFTASTLKPDFTEFPTIVKRQDNGSWRIFGNRTRIRSLDMFISYRREVSQGETIALGTNIWLNSEESSSNSVVSGTISGGNISGSLNLVKPSGSNAWNILNPSTNNSSTYPFYTNAGKGVWPLSVTHTKGQIYRVEFKFQDNSTQVYRLTVPALPSGIAPFGENDVIVTESNGKLKIEWPQAASGKGFSVYEVGAWNSSGNRFFEETYENISRTSVEFSTSGQGFGVLMQTFLGGGSFAISYSNQFAGTSSRFSQDAKGIITDSLTGLQWYCVNTWPKYLTYAETKEWADNLAVDNGGWRMATKGELLALYPDAFPEYGADWGPTFFKDPIKNIEVPSSLSSTVESMHTDPPTDGAWHVGIHDSVCSLSHLEHAPAHGAIAVRNAP